METRKVSDKRKGQATSQQKRPDMVKIAVQDAEQLLLRNKMEADQRSTSNQGSISGLKEIKPDKHSTSKRAFREKHVHEEPRRQQEISLNSYVLKHSGRRNLRGEMDDISTRAVQGSCIDEESSRQQGVSVNSNSLKKDIPNSDRTNPQELMDSKYTSTRLMRRRYLDKEPSNQQERRVNSTSESMEVRFIKKT